ncbi:MAG: hypothetical protein JJU12_05095 [Chlamydiales bacterium]|nr:hypothetical protein [Chlamydiales bacterium]
MYKKELTLFGIGLFLAVLFFGFSISRITDKDREKYRELIERSSPTQKPLLSFSQQTREGVLKEIWYQEKDPLYIRIESADSELFFFHREGRIEVVEELESVVCLMQEELFYEEDKPMQHIRYMEAKRASYNYNTQLFVSEEAKLWKYRLQGHDPVLSVEGETPLMSGTADRVEFTFRGKQLDFQAHRLKAIFNRESL